MATLTDEMAEKLLELMLVAITEFGDADGNMTIDDFCEDILNSMDHISDKAEEFYFQIDDVLA